MSGGQVHRRQLMRHARILHTMMAAGASLDRIGDSFVHLAEHPDFMRCSRPVRDRRLEAHLWGCAVAAGLVDADRVEEPIPLMRHDAADLVHGTLPRTGLLPVIVCWFEPEADGLFITADLERGRDYHRLSQPRGGQRGVRRPSGGRWRPFGRAPTAPPG